jgi:hypothetical protein
MGIQHSTVQVASAGAFQIQQACPSYESELARRQICSMTRVSHGGYTCRHHNGLLRTSHSAISYLHPSIIDRTREAPCCMHLGDPAAKNLAL